MYGQGEREPAWQRALRIRSAGLNRLYGLDWRTVDGSGGTVFCACWPALPEQFGEVRHGEVPTVLSRVGSQRSLVF
jgi:hypothetical protein